MVLDINGDELSVGDEVEYIKPDSHLLVVKLKGFYIVEGLFVDSFGDGWIWIHDNNSTPTRQVRVLSSVFELNTIDVKLDKLGL